MVLEMIWSSFNEILILLPLITLFDDQPLKLNSIINSRPYNMLIIQGVFDSMDRVDVLHNLNLRLFT